MDGRDSIFAELFADTSASDDFLALEREQPKDRETDGAAEMAIENADFQETGFSNAMRMLAGKYKCTILYALMRHEPVRFNELQRYMKKISDRTLSLNLKELEADNLIVRTVYSQIPPRVEYSLAERGQALAEIFQMLERWGEQNR